MKLELKRLHPEAKLPTQAYPGSVGWDLYAFALDHKGVANTVSMMMGQTRRIRTGLQYGGLVPEGHETHEAFCMVCSRSGLAGDSIFVANAPGIIDPDFRGEIEVLLFNGSSSPKYIRHGDRIAQLVVQHVTKFWLFETEQLMTATPRGDKGFGSSGK